MIIERHKLPVGDQQAHGLDLIDNNAPVGGVGPDPAKLAVHRSVLRGDEMVADVDREDEQYQFLCRR